MIRGTIQEFAGESGKHVDRSGEDCVGRSFLATFVGVGGAYTNTVACVLCQKEFLASERALLPEASNTMRKPPVSESASPSELREDYRLQCGRIIQTVREVRPGCAVIFDQNRAPQWLRFRIEHQSTVLTKASPEYHVGEVADWTPKKMRQTIAALTSAALGQSA